MKKELNLDDEATEFFNDLKSKRDELVVPLKKWNRHIKNNSRVDEEDIPNHMVCGKNVVTQREWFFHVIGDLGDLYYQPKKLTREEGGFWIVDKLEPEDEIPKKDIFNAGKRSSGSFNSKR